MRINLSILIIFILWVELVRAQPIYFEKSYNSPNQVENGTSVLNMQGSGYLIAAASYDPTNFFSSSIYLIRTNAYGDTLWTKSIRKGAIGLEPIQMRKVSANRIIIGGNTDCNSGLCHNFFLSLIDTLGDTIWVHTYLPKPYHYSIFSDVITTNDHGFLAIGDANITDTCSLLITAFGTKAEIMKTDSTGNLKWLITTNGDTGTLAGGVSVVQTVYGNFIVAGYTSRYDAFEVYDAYLASIDENGTLQWERTYGTYGVYDGLRTIISTSADDYLAGGYQQDFNHFWKQWIIDVDANGYQKWDKIFGQDSLRDAEFVKSYAADNNTVVYIGGQNFTNAPHQGLIMKVTESGDSLWSRLYHFPNENIDDVFYDFHPTSDSGYIITGTCHPYTQDVWLLKLDQYGCLVPGCQLNTGITNVINDKESMQVFPNPASGFFTLRINENFSRPYNLSIFDPFGRNVASKKISPGEHMIQFQTSGWMKGLYLVQITGGATQWIEKIMVE